MHIQSENPRQLQNEDTINLANAPLHERDDEDTVGWFDLQAAGTASYLTQNCNFIWWVFDTRAQTCCISMKCAALVVSLCTASFLRDLLDSLEVEWGVAAVNRLTTDVYIEIDSDTWEIRDIDKDNDTVVLHNVDIDTTIKHTIEYCMNRIM